MEAAQTSKTSIYNETTWRYIPVGSRVHTCRRENLKYQFILKEILPPERNSRDSVQLMWVPVQGIWRRVLLVLAQKGMRSSDHQVAFYANVSRHFKSPQRRSSA